MYEVMEAGKALERGGKLPYALLRSLSRVSLGPTPERIDGEELIEARFFNAEEEIRIFRGETGLQAVRVWEEEGDAVIDCPCRPENAGLFGQSVTVRRLLCFDEDGQARVSHTRLAGWKGGR